MYCSKCGAEVPNDSAFCSSCGNPIREPSTPVQSGTVVASAKKKPSAKLLAGAGCGIVIVAIIAMVASGMLSGGYKSADDLAADLGKATEQWCSSFTPEAMVACVENSLDCMYPDFVDPLFAEEDYTREQFIEEIGAAYTEADVADELELIKNLDIEVTFKPAGYLSSDEIDEINEAISDMGVNARVTDAAKISGKVKITASADIPELDISAGETDTIDEDIYGAALVEIDGKWYLWCEDIDGLGSVTVLGV